MAKTLDVGADLVKIKSLNWWRRKGAWRKWTAPDPILVSSGKKKLIQKGCSSCLLVSLLSLQSVAFKIASLPFPIRFNMDHSGDGIIMLIVLLC